MLSLRFIKNALQKGQKSHLQMTGCCPNKDSFKRSLKRFLLINLGEAGRSVPPWAGSKNVLDKAKKGFGKRTVE